MAKRKMSTFERLRKGERISRREGRDLQRRLELEGPELEVVGAADKAGNLAR
jgi:hypothetical protein